MLIGLTGTLGAGKGTVAEYLVERKGFKHVSVSDFLASVADERGMGSDRMARHNIANELRAKSPTALMEAVLESAGDVEGNILVEPQHIPAEVKFIQGQGGIVMAVDADLSARYDRIKKRGSAKDNVSFEEFSKHQQMELTSDDPNRNNLGAAIQAADFHIRNDTTLEELHAQIDAIFEKIKGKGA